MTGRKVILAAGGTGGHIFPALALGDALLRRGVAVGLITDDRGRRFKDKNPDIVIRCIRAASPSKGGVAGKLKAILQLGVGTVQSALHLKSLNATIAVGFGGYPSVPTVRAAAFLGVPVVLHEQNAVLGRANGSLPRTREKLPPPSPR